MTELLDTVEIATGTDPDAAVVWLHGLGADGHDFEPIVPQLGLSRAGAVRFVFPHAPVRPVTINAGMSMRAWYDIVGIHPDAPQDDAGIRDSASRVTALIDREVERGIPTERIVLAGFSQGGAIALHVGVRETRKLAGLMGLSTYLPLSNAAENERADANADTSVFMAHGTLDPVVPASYGESSAQRLVSWGYPLQWKTYTMPHAVCPEEIRDIRDWLDGVLT